MKYANLIVTAILVCFMFACRTSDKVVSKHFLTKRKYNKGWYVNSISNHSSKIKEKYKNVSERNADTLIIFMPKTENVENIHEELFASNELKPIAYKEYKKVVLQYTTAVSISDTNKVAKKENRKKKIENKNTEEVPPKTNIKALLSFFIVSIWGILGFLAYYYSIAYFYFLILSLLVLSIPFIVLTTIAIVKWIKCKECYKNNGFLIPGVIVMGVLVLIGAFATFLYILNYSYHNN